MYMEQSHNILFQDVCLRQFFLAQIAYKRSRKIFFFDPSIYFVRQSIGYCLVRSALVERRRHYYYNFIVSITKGVGRPMEKSNSRAHLAKEVKGLKPPSNSSKNKKQSKISCSKNLKLLKSPPSRQQPHTEQQKLKQETSPNSVNRTILDNDYGVSNFYTKYKVKTSKKKEFQDQYQSTDYGHFNNSRDAQHITQFEARPQKKAVEKDDSDYASNAFQKLKLPNQRGLINAEGKFVSAKKQTGLKNYSFKEVSTSKNSFSLNFTNREGSRRKLNKSKSKKLHSNKSLDQKAHWRSGDKNQTHSYYQKRKSYSKKKKKQSQSKEIIKILEINSKATTETELQSSVKGVNFIANDDLMIEVRAEISKEMQASKGTIRKNRLSDTQLRERTRCIQLLGKLCGALAMKRQSFYLAVFFMDQYLSQFPVTSLKIVALGALTLGLKIDDAEMISKFCFQYLYNPEKTVKRNSSGTQLRLKQKQKEMKEPNDQKQLKGRLSSILSSRISEQKRGAKEQFTLDEILDFETQMMVKLGFKLVTKTINYWTDIFTALWDSFVNEYRPDFIGTLQFRSESQGRNWNYLLQLLEGQFTTMAVYSLSRISLVLGGLYVVARMALHERKEETPWEELCRYYRASLAKSSNLVFCDGVGINPLFGDFLVLFDLSLANIVDAIQALSRHLLPEVIKVHDYHKIEGKTREDRLSTYVYNEQLHRATG